MIRQSFALLAVLSMAACSTSSGSGSGTTSAVPSGGGSGAMGGGSAGGGGSNGNGGGGATGGGTTGGGATGGGTTGGGTTGGGTTGGGTTGGGGTTTTGGTPTNGSVFAIGDAKSFAQAQGSSSYSVAAASTPVTLVRTNSASSDQATYDLTINGNTYNLMPSANNRPNSSTNSFVSSSGGTSVSLFLNENAANASIANTQVKTGSVTKEYFSIVGTPTDTASLPANAVYSGIGEISIDTGQRAFDDAPGSTVTMNADFTSGTLTGQFDVMDPAGDSTGLVDIAGTAMLPMTGTIQGNTFSADVDFSELINISNGLNLVKSGSINGGFFGAAGDEAVGVGVNVGRSAQPNDVLIYTRIQAAKQ